jgi:hypothetical protein
VAQGSGSRRAAASESEATVEEEASPPRRQGDRVEWKTPVAVAVPAAESRPPGLASAAKAPSRPQATASLSPIRRSSKEDQGRRPERRGGQASTRKGKGKGKPPSKRR